MLFLIGASKFLTVFYRGDEFAENLSVLFSSTLYYLFMKSIRAFDFVYKPAVGCAHESCSSAKVSIFSVKLIFSVLNFVGSTEFLFFLKAGLLV